MGLLEDSLRETFAAVSATAPATRDPAGRAIRTARGIRLRRTALGGVAVLASVMLIGTGVVAVARGQSSATVGGPPAYTLPAGAYPLPADVVIGGKLILTSGRAIDLSDLPEIRQAWRVDGGWLVETRERGLRSAVWFVDEAGGRRRLAEGERVAVGRGSFPEARVSWGADGVVSYATLLDGGLTPPIETLGVGRLGPVAIVGTGVLLGGVVEGTPMYDMWFPVQGRYAEGPVRHHPFLGVSGDGSALYGLVGEPYPCLAKVNPVGLNPMRTGCDLDITAEQTLHASPDLRWLVAAGRGRVELYDATTLWSVPVPVATWPISATSVAWLADGSFAVGAMGKVVHLFVDDWQRRENTPVTDAAVDAVMVVTELRY